MISVAGCVRPRLVFDTGLARIIYVYLRTRLIRQFEILTTFCIFFFHLGLRILLLCRIAVFVGVIAFVQGLAVAYLYDARFHLVFGTLLV